MSIKLEHISYSYGSGTPFEKLALNDVTLTLEKGEIVAVIGHTGSGKSTLIQHLNGLLHPASGVVAIDGIDLASVNAAAKAAQQQVGMVFQYPEQQLFAESVYEDIAFGARNKGMSPEEVDKEVREAMAFVGLDFEEFAQRSPVRLSGGQMRRVAIAGVIAMAPDYLVLDEPSAGLDPGSRDAIFCEIMHLQQSRGIAVVLVTHDMEEAARYAKRLLVINEGRLLFDASPVDIFRDHAEKLFAIGLDVPPTVKLAALLRERGLALSTDIITETELVRQLQKLCGRKL